MFPKIIASDIDGTLVPEGAKSLGERTLSLIEEYLDKGGIFVASSGRQLENMRDLFGPVKDRISYICYSGGLCLHNKEVVYERFLEPAFARELMLDIENTDGCEAMASVRGAELISDKEPRLYTFLTESIGAYAEVAADLSERSEGVYKVSLYQHEGVTDRDLWKARYIGQCNVLNSGRVWIDFIPHGVNKGAALDALLKRLGLSPDDCVAFGDNENDRGMLMTAGCPIVMKTAPDEIKALGRYVTDSVDKTLEKLLGKGSGR